MNGQSTLIARGLVVRVSFEGTRAGSASLMIYLEAGMAFEVYVDTLGERYFKLFNTACSAMWDRKNVEVIYQIRGGDGFALDIRAL
ncbi:MAG: hypothetical protein E7774_06470 [Bradyrhizobium sp.]|nr:MAG: hypothetical protein E7774_06470 [Bradyrhizobium sp.]